MHPENAKGIRWGLPTRPCTFDGWMGRLWLLLLLLVMGAALIAQLGEGGEEWPQGILSLIEKGSYEQALASLQERIDQDPHSPWSERALYLLGHVEEKLNHVPQATLYYELARKEYGKLGDYVELKLARLYSTQESHEKAYQTFIRLQQDYPWSILLPRAYLYGLQELIVLGRYEEAAKEFKAFMERYGQGPLAVQAILSWAKSLEGQSRAEEAQELYQKLYLTYPTDPAAEVAWKKMLELDPYKSLTLPVRFLSLFQNRAQQLFQEKKYDKALEAYRTLIFLDPQSQNAQEARFQAALCYDGMRNRLRAGRLLEVFARHHPQSPRLPEILYWIGKIHWNNQMNPEGGKFLGRLLSEFPTNVWTEKGLYILGRMAEEENDGSPARKFYGRLISEFPRGSMAAEARWRLGWMDYLNDDPAQAAKSFQELSGLDSGWVEPALYWQGRSLEKTNDREGAAILFQRLALEHGYSYYGIQGRERWATLQQDKTALEKNLIEIFSLKPASAGNGLSQKEGLQMGEKEAFHLERVKELGEMGFREECNREIDALAGLLPPQDENRLYVGELYFQNGLFFQAIKTLNQSFQNLPLSGKREMSMEFWRAFYPRLYWEEIRQQARENGLDPFLIAALIRQESAFESNAVSPAGAHGLMQVLPRTGEAVSRNLGLIHFRREKLFDPRINISLGTRYLAQLVERFGGNLSLALAGYNAGPEKVKKWMERSPKTDAEIFIENIPYEETRNYVKNVLRNLFIYRRIYGSQA